MFAASDAIQLVSSDISAQQSIFGCAVLLTAFQAKSRYIICPLLKTSLLDSVATCISRLTNNLGETLEAIKSFDKSLAVNPNDVE